MQIADPNKIIPNITEPHDSFLSIIKKSNVWLVQNLECRPSEKIIEQAREYLSFTVGLEIPIILFKKLLDLYPTARISLGSTEVIETQDLGELMFIASHFFTGCDSLRRGTTIEDAFYKVMEKQAAAILQDLGYEVTPYKGDPDLFDF